MSNDKVREALAFYADPENHAKQLVLEDTLGVWVPRDCPDKDAHARQSANGFDDAGFPTGVPPPVVPHDCGLGTGMNDPREHVVMKQDLRYWGTPPVLKDGGTRARDALSALARERGDEGRRAPALTAEERRFMEAQERFCASATKIG